MPAPLTIILNPASGGGNSIEQSQKLANLFHANGKDTRVIPARTGAEIVKLAGNAVADGAEAVVAAGGDGTVSAVASVLAGKETPMGVLPLGTLNHFARDLRIPGDLEGAVRLISVGRTLRIDVGEVNGHIFINNSSLGIYPTIVRHREFQQRMGFGKWPAFAWALLAALRRYPFLRLRLEADGRTFVRKTPLVFVGNNAYEMEGLNIGSRTSLMDGQLSLYVTHRTARLGLLRLALNALLGRLRAQKNFEAICTREVWIETHRKRLQVAFDGEVTTMEPPLHYRILPGALRVIAP